MALFDKSRGPKSTVAFAILLVIAIGCSVVYSREGDLGPLHAVQSLFNTAASPLAMVGVKVDEATNDAAQQVEDALASDETLSDLLAQIADLQQQLAEATEYKEKAQDLEEMLHLRDVYDIDGVAANVIARSSEAYNQTITINRGSDDGIVAGQSVTGAHGVIGQVISTTGGTSVVRLITDSQSGVAVLLQATRAEGVAKGSLDGLIYLENVSSDSVVEVGDVVVSSGMGGSYIRGLIVGQVTKVTQASGDASRVIVVSPADSGKTCETVMVIKDMGSMGAAA